ncbi:MAG: Oxidoreductase [Claussenomyces sp. TS43310]|nr:MAG: Oxidoreductase [Claussenomyces sp. TS43310]
MFKIAARQASRGAIRVSPSSRRFLSTAPPKSRSWRSSFVRWGAAAGLIYYYNTSSLFAEEPEAAISRVDQTIHRVQESSLPTLEAIAEEKRKRQAEIRAKAIEDEIEAAEAAEAVEVAETTDVADTEDSIEDLEEEADQQGAFNPETGEINWDCPCLGGMAHGPCGDEFREAFSCFIFSKEEPKGVECIDKFKGMQDCFRQHPEMYGSELEDDEDELEEEIRSEVAEKESQKDQGHRDATSPSQKPENAGDEGGDLVPRALHDATPKN